ncbi:hypothetical protein DXG03_004259, partial [Asterophora parasitica]
FVKTFHFQVLLCKATPGEVSSSVEVNDSTHTANSRRWEGPLAVLPGGRLMRASKKGSVGVWDLDSLQNHGPSGKETIGGSYATGEDEDFFGYGDEKVEVSASSKTTDSIELQDKTVVPYTWAPLCQTPA